MSRYIKIRVPDDFDPETQTLTPVDRPDPNTPVAGMPSVECPVFEHPYTKMLDHGFVGLVDFMGSDQSIVNSARTSYGRGTKRVSSDRTLIRFLKRHAHTTPFESITVTFHVKAPIFVFRQWHRHRTACLAGDVTLDFQTPASGRRHPMTIKKFHDLWHGVHMQPGKSKEKPSYTERLEVGRMYSIPELALRVERREEDIRNLIRRGALHAERIESGDRQKPSLFVDAVRWSMWANNRASVPTGMSRDRLKRMNLRYYNEETDALDTTHVVDIWSNGTKGVYRVFTETGMLRLTADHLCLTDQGWMILSDIVDLNTGKSSAKLARIRPTSGTNPIQKTTPNYSEDWRRIADTKGYEVSSYGRVRSYLKDSVNFMKLTDRQGYLCVALQYVDGTQRTRQVHHLVLESFGRPREGNEECRHLNGNPADNRLTNLKWGTPKENGEDRVIHDSTVRNRLVFEDIVELEYDGEEEVFDLEVETPFHNFIADGFVVHNSINEMSARYSVLDNEMYIPEPEQMKGQAVVNRQGRSEDSLTAADYLACASAMEQLNSDSYGTYQYLLGQETVIDPETKKETHYRFPPPDAINVRKLHVEGSAVEAVQKIKREKLERGESWNPTEADLNAKILEYYEANGLAVTSEEFPGLARELARLVLPVSTYSQMYWTVNLHNLFHFLRLRMDPHAQYEIRVFAQAMFDQVSELFPDACEAFVDYQLQAKTFSRMELVLLGGLATSAMTQMQTMYDAEGYVREKATALGMTKRETDEFLAWLEKSAEVKQLDQKPSSRMAPLAGSNESSQS